MNMGHAQAAGVSSSDPAIHRPLFSFTQRGEHLIETTGCPTTARFLQLDPVRLTAPRNFKRSIPLHTYGEEEVQRVAAMWRLSPFEQCHCGGHVPASQYGQPLLMPGGLYNFL
jgi:hypothetical protein